MPGSVPGTAVERPGPPSSQARQWAGPTVLLHLFLLVPVAASCGDGATRAAPAETASDLRLDWLEADAAPGQSAWNLSLRITNTGAADAYATLIDVVDPARGSVTADRLQPGPAAGESVVHRIRLDPAPGSRRICVEARLQTLDLAAAVDPDPRNNRRCLELDEAHRSEGND